VSEVIVEIQGPLVFRLVHDKELGYLYAQIPVGKRLPGAVVREIRTATHDPWRYVEGMGLLLDISAWTNESDLDPQTVGKALEAKYREILDAIKKIVDEAGEARSGRRRRRGRRKRSRRSRLKRSRKKGRKSKK